MVHQISLSNVAAHAVAQQKHWNFGMPLADRLIHAGQIADYLAPALLVSEMPEYPLGRRFAVAALIVGI